MKDLKQQKRQETLVLIILALVLAVIMLVSKFVIGINFSLMEQGGYISFGYHEIRASQFWSLEFESFTGSISAEGRIPEEGKRRLLVHSGAGNSGLELEVKCGKDRQVYKLQGDPLDLSIPGTDNKLVLTLSGTEVLTGYFNAVWE